MMLKIKKNKLIYYKVTYSNTYHRMNNPSRINNSINNIRGYDNLFVIEESIPMNYSHKNSMYEGLDISLTSPNDVTITGSDKLSESELESVKGIDSSIIIDSDMMLYTKKRNIWSATSTMQHMTNFNTDSSDNPQVDSNIFQVFISEMVRDKCWNQKDVDGFIQNIKNISEFMNEDLDNDDRLEMVLNPKYYNVIHNILDNLDTINVVCTLGTGNKCNMIENPEHKAIIKKQVQIIGKLVEIYTPIFIRMILMIDRIIGELSSENSCNLDPVYLKTIELIKNRVVSAMYMNSLINKTRQEQNEVLRQMSNGYNDKNTDNIVMNYSENSIEHYDNIDPKKPFSNYVMIFIIVVLIGIVIYVIYNNE